MAAVVPTPTTAAAHMSTEQASQRPRLAHDLQELVDASKESLGSGPYNQISLLLQKVHGRETQELYEHEVGGEAAHDYARLVTAHGEALLQVTPFTEPCHSLQLNFFKCMSGSTFFFNPDRTDFTRASTFWDMTRYGLRTVAIAWPCFRQSAPCARACSA